jgi:ABC-type nitrate/sulfonate/bicarbonate transport system permease component
VSARTHKTLKIAAEIAVPILILVAWQLATALKDSDSTPADRWPRLSTILHLFQKMWLFDQFDSQVLPSLERIALGFLIAVVLGVAIGIPLGLSRWAHRGTMPIIEFFRNIPPPAMLPIFVILLGIRNNEKVGFIAFFCLFPVLLNTIDGVRGIDPTMIDTARSYGVPRHARIRKIVLPAAFPQIVAGMRNSISLAVIMMVLAEYFSSTEGVGHVLLDSKNTFQMGPMWATILLIGVLGYLLNILFLVLERRALSWHRGWRAATPQ